jgi:hypothetical protein
MSDTRRKIATLSKLAAVLSIEVDWAPLLRFSCDNLHLTGNCAVAYEGGST